MKTLLLTTLLALSSTAFAGEEMQVEVKGMVCSFCAQGIEKKFKKEPEIEKVSVSLENKYVKLTFKDNKKLSNTRITEILKDAGYEASFPEK